MLWLLDASKLVSTSPLDLSMIETHERPHFICLSFYKIFGYPTGLGALIVRKDIAHILTKRYYGGGTVQAISAIDNFVIKRKLNGSIGSLGKVFEDGTINYQGISAVRHGINAFNAIGGMKMINQFTTGLRNYLQARLISLKHTTGTPMLTIYGSDQRGPLVNEELGYEAAVCAIQEVVKSIYNYLPMTLRITIQLDESVEMICHSIS
eukprot:gene19493-25379_t